MPRPIEPLPPPGALASWAVGQQVSGGLFEGIAEALAFLCGRNLPQILSATDLAPLDTQDVYVIYQRTPACRALAIAIELQGDAAGGRSTVNITLDTGSGSIAWYPTLGTSESNGQLDGSSELPATNTVQRDYPIFEGILDVSNLTVGAVSVLRFSSGDVSSSGGQGIFSLSIWEVPLAACDPVASPSGEIGVDPGWLVGGNGIVAGSETSPRGIGRIMREADRAREEVPRHWQVLTPEGAAWEQAISGTGALDWGSRFTGLDHVWRIRARKLYTDAGNRVRFLARYAWNGSGSGVIRCIASSLNTGGATSTSAEIPLQNTGGSAVYRIDYVELELPVDGTAQELELTFECEADDAVCSVTNLVLIERESDPPAILHEAEFWWETDDLELTGASIDQWNDKTGRGRHGVLGTANKAELINGQAQFFYSGNFNGYQVHYATHPTAFPDGGSWSALFVGSFQGVNCDWVFVCADDLAAITKGFGLKEEALGTYPKVRAFDKEFDNTPPIGARTTEALELTDQAVGGVASLLVEYNADDETLTIYHSSGDSTQKTGVTAPGDDGSYNDLWLGVGNDPYVSFDGTVCVFTFWKKTLTANQRESLFEYARAAHGAL